MKIASLMTIFLTPVCSIPKIGRAGEIVGSVIKVPMRTAEAETETQSRIVDVAKMVDGECNQRKSSSFRHNIKLNDDISRTVLIQVSRSLSRLPLR